MICFHLHFFPSSMSHGFVSSVSSGIPFSLCNPYFGLAIGVFQSTHGREPYWSEFDSDLYM